MFPSYTKKKKKKTQKNSVVGAQDSLNEGKSFFVEHLGIVQHFDLRVKCSLIAVTISFTIILSEERIVQKSHILDGFKIRVGNLLLSTYGTFDLTSL